MIFSRTIVSSTRDLPKPLCLALAGALVLAGGTAPLMAQDQDEDDGGFVVIGAASLPEFEGADDQQIVPFAVTRFNAFGIGVEVEGLQGRFNILGDDTIWRAGPAFSLSPPRDADDPRLFALGDRGEVDFAVEVGGYVGFETPFGGLKEGTLSGHIFARHDVLGAHNGWLVTPEIEYFFAVNRMFRVGATANLTWASNDYMDSYFGVTAEGAGASGLAEFNPGSGIKDVGAALYSIFSFSEQWGVFSRVAYNRLLGDAADSSIVTDIGDKNQLFYGAGIFYRF